MGSVKLAPAYAWDCPHCGTANFQRAVYAQLTEEAERDYMVRMGMIEEWEPAPEDTGLDVMGYPDNVVCRKCETMFTSEFEHLLD